MAHRLCLLLVAVLVTAQAADIATCPRSLSSVLTSSACSNHMDRLLSDSSTTIMATDELGDVCVDSLRALLATAPSVPCRTNIEATSTHNVRRLSDDSGPFKGKLNCTFDTRAPLNLSDPHQHFVVDCKEIPGPYDYSWIWITALCVVGPFVAIYLFAYVWDFATKARNAFDQWRERRRQAAIDKAEAKPTGHAYALA